MATSFQTKSRVPPDVESPEQQITRIQRHDLAWLLQGFPSNSWHEATFKEVGDQWCFDFVCNSAKNHFNASGTGPSPNVAFAIAKQMLLEQIHDWQEARFDSALKPKNIEHHAYKRVPRILIADDDVDLALAMQKALLQLGHPAEIFTQHEGLHRKIISGKIDYILLDWKWNDQVTADEVVRRAVRLIEAFPGFRRRFRMHRPQIITYSVLDRAEIALPFTGKRYFDHVDHWQKPMRFEEVIEKAHGLLAARAA